MKIAVDKIVQLNWFILGGIKRPAYVCSFAIWRGIISAQLIVLYYKVLLHFFPFCLVFPFRFCTVKRWFSFSLFRIFKSIYPQPLRIFYLSSKYWKYLHSYCCRNSLSDKKYNCKSYDFACIFLNKCNLLISIQNSIFVQFIFFYLYTTTDQI